MPPKHHLQAQRAAKEFIETLNVGLRDLFPTLATTTPTWRDKENLRKIGQHVYHLVCDRNEGVYPTDDDEVFQKSLAFAEEVDSMVLGASLLIPAFQIRWIWAGRWYEQGMPHIVWEHAAYPEMLMASSADPNCIEVAKPPWRAFLMDLPRRLLYSRSPTTGKPAELEHLLVSHLNIGNMRRWAMLADSPGCFELWRHGLSTEELLETGSEFHSALFQEFVDKADDRLFLLFGRLIIGLCLTLSDPSKIREARHTKNRSCARVGKLRKDTEPSIRNFVVGAPTKLKVRDTLQSFVEHGVRKGSSPTVQSLVRGHWKMQPHGPQSSLRKLIYREPFWRGPEEAPIVVKDRVL